MHNANMLQEIFFLFFFVQGSEQQPNMYGCRIFSYTAAVRCSLPAPRSILNVGEVVDICDSHGFYIRWLLISLLAHIE